MSKCVNNSSDRVQILFRGCQKAGLIDYELSQSLNEKNNSLTKQNQLLEARMNNKELVYILTILSIYEANKNISNNNKCASTEALSKVMISEWRQELKEKILMKKYETM